MTGTTPIAVLLWALPLLCGEPPSPFAGTWEGAYHNTVYARLIVQDGTPVSGRLVTGRVYTYEDGSLRGVRAAEGEGDMLEHVTAEDGKLLFAADGDRMELRLTDAGTAELRFTDLPAGTKLKPFVLKRR